MKCHNSRTLPLLALAFIAVGLAAHALGWHWFGSWALGAAFGWSGRGWVVSKTVVDWVYRTWR